MRMTLLVAALSLMVASACGKPEPTDEPATATEPTPSAPAAAPKPPPDSAAQAKEIFAQRCTPCHGAEGRGDGVASAQLTPRPRNFHDADWQKSVQDTYLTQIIKLGGAAVGKSPAMPGNPDLRDPAVVEALKNQIRAFGNQP
jgi:mono/diheme cytochrome c family protein